MESAAPQDTETRPDIEALIPVAARIAALASLAVSLLALAAGLLHWTWAARLGIALPPERTAGAMAAVAMGVGIILAGGHPSRLRLGAGAGLILIAALPGVFAIAALAVPAFQDGAAILGTSPATAGMLILMALAALLSLGRSRIAAIAAASLACLVLIAAVFGLLAGVLWARILGSAFTGLAAAVPTTMALALLASSVLAWTLLYFTEQPATPRFLIRRISLFATATSLAIAVFLVWAALAANDYMTTARVLEANARAASRLIEEHGLRSMDAAFQVLDRIADQVGERGLTSVAGVKELGRLRMMTSRTPQIALLLVADADGRVVLAEGHAQRATVATVGDRPFYLALRQGAHTYFGPGVPPLIEGRRIFTLSRRLEDAKGGFAGVALAGIDSAYFDGFYANLHISPLFAAAIVRDSGEFLVRYPTDGTEGKDIAHLSLTARRIVNTQASGTFVRISPIDGLRRYVAFRRIGDLPLIALASVPEKDVLSAWASRETRDLPVLVVLVALGAAGTWWGFRTIRSEERDYRHLQELATIDPLTGTNNRRSFFGVARREFTLSRRLGTRFCILMADADRFKSINDEHGHHAGDRVLVEMAEACRSQLRDVDVLGRLGGEEFAVALPGADLAGARVVAERIRNACAATAVAVGGRTVRFRVSIGVAEASAADSAVEDVIHRADRALYRAKALGRDRVEVE